MASIPLQEGSDCYVYKNFNLLWYDKNCWSQNIRSVCDVHSLRSHAPLESRSLILPGTQIFVLYCHLSSESLCLRINSKLEPANFPNQCKYKCNLCVCEGCLRNSLFVLYLFYSTTIYFVPSTIFRSYNIDDIWTTFLFICRFWFYPRILGYMWYTYCNNISSCSALFWEIDVEYISWGPHGVVVFKFVNVSWKKGFIINFEPRGRFSWYLVRRYCHSWRSRCNNF